MLLLCVPMDMPPAGQKSPKSQGFHGCASGGSKISKKSGVPMDVPPAGQKSKKVRGYDGRAMKVVITTGYGYGYIQFVMTLRIQSEVGGISGVYVSKLCEILAWIF